MRPRTRFSLQGCATTRLSASRSETCGQANSLLRRVSKHIRIGLEQGYAEQPIVIWRLLCRRNAEPLVVGIKCFGLVGRHNGRPLFDRAKPMDASGKADANTSVPGLI